MSYLLFDLGATNLRVAAVSEADWSAGNLGETRTIAHPEGGAGTLAVFNQILSELKPADGFSVAAGGLTRKLIEVVPELTKVIARPLYLENDTALAGLGEAVVGAGRGQDIVMYVTVSTGVGGVRVVDGRIDRKVAGFEPGWQWLNLDGEPKTLQDHISGAALAAKYGRAPKDILDEGVWRAAARTLAIGLFNMILHWSPRVVVLGGSMFKHPGIDLSLVKTELDQFARWLPAMPEIRPAALGDLGGLHGAAVYLKQQLAT